MTNKDVPITTLVYMGQENRTTISPLEKGTNEKRRKLKKGHHEILDTAFFTWFLSVQRQNVPLSS